MLFFDADDTLLDFKKSEDISFQMILNKNGISGDFKKFLNSYKIINDSLWSQHAEGLISKDFLKLERFKRFLDENNLEACPDQMCADYLNTLPTQVFLIDGAIELLKKIDGKIPLVIITNGIGIVQHKRLEKSGIKTFIELIVVSEECGFSKPDRRIFDYTFKLLKKSPLQSKVLMIGDKLETDILGAHNSKIDSCWFNPEKTPNTISIAPTYEVQNILDVLDYL